MLRVYASMGGRPPPRGVAGRSRPPRPTTGGGKPPRTERKEVSLREVAVEQLRRIEEDGAYSGLVSGSKVEDIDADLDRVFSGVYEGEDAMTSPSGGGGGGSNGRGQDSPATAHGGMLALANPADRRLVTEIVNGCTRWRKKLDYIIGRLTKRDVNQIDPPLRLLLRVGLYELMALGMPDHVINEHVDVARALTRKPYAPGFVNGTLRSAIREGLTAPPGGASAAVELITAVDEDGMGDRVAAGAGAASSSGRARGSRAAVNALELLKIKGSSQAEALSLTYSHPMWMVERWISSLGPEATERLMQHNNRRPTFSIRKVGGLNVPMRSLQTQLEEQGVHVRPSAFLPAHFLTVESGLQLALPIVRDGYAAVQDESAGLVVAMLDPQPGETICDTCAAPGGKALFAADLVGAEGTVFALDVNKRRVEAIENFSGVLGLEDRVICAQADLLELGRPGRLEALTGGRLRGFDKLLLDVPCTGLGVLGKRADLRWRRTEAQLHELTQLQAKMLRSAAQLMNVGGVLVYSTCSPDPAETVDQVRAFLRDHPDFVLDAPPKGVPKECLTQEGFLLTQPQVHGVDGAFAARLKRVR